MKRIASLLFYSLVLLLPTQLGKHFWPDSASVAGIRVDYLSPTVYVTDILVGLLFLVWMVGSMKSKNGKKRIMHDTGHTEIHFMVRFLSSAQVMLQRTSLIFFGLFCTYLLTTIFIGNNLPNGLYALLKFLEFSFVAFYTARSIKNPQQLRRIFLLLCVAVGGESILAIAQYLHQSSLNGLLYYVGERTFTSQTPGIANAAINGQLILRPYATFPHPNVLAGYLLISMTLVVFLTRSKHVTLPWWIVGTSMLLGTSAILLTMSRVAIILWVLVLGGLFLQKLGSVLQRRKQKKRVPVFIVGLVASGLVLFFLSPLPARFLETNLAEEAVQHRYALFSAALQLTMMSPVVGIGLGNFLPSLQAIQDPLSLSLYLQPVHNIFLLILAEVGIVGLAMVLSFFFRTFRRLVMLARQQTSQAVLAKALVIALGMVVILGLFDHYWLTLQQGQLLLAVLLGLSWSSMKTAT